MSTWTVDRAGAAVKGGTARRLEREPRRLPVVRRGSRVRGACRWILVAFLVLGPPTLVPCAHASPADPDSLGASSGVPWNPPRAMAGRRGWEQAMLLPGRVVSLPLSGLGRVTDALLFRLEQDPRLANGLAASGGSGGSAVVLKTPRMGDRTGLGGAVEVRQDLLHGAFRSRISGEYTATLRGYDRTRLTWSGHPLSLQYAYEWRPQDRFYGLGNDSPSGRVSDYASQGESVRGGLAWESNRPRDPARPHSALDLWAGTRSQVTRTGRERGAASYETRFPALAEATLDRRVENLVYGASLLDDRRLGSPHWSHGWRTLLSAERFDAPLHALALHSATGEGAQFTRYQAEAEVGLSFMRDPRTLRLLVRMEDQQVRSNRDRMLVSDLATLGGHAGLGGYPPGRFHDLDLLLTRLAYVFPLERRFEVDLHTEWGAVYPDLWRDAKFDTFHNSFGFALRVRDDRGPLASIGFDFSREASRLRFSLGGVE